MWYHETESSFWYRDVAWDLITRGRDSLNIAPLLVYVTNLTKHTAPRPQEPSVDVSPSAAGQKRSLRTHHAQGAAPALLNARARMIRAAGQSAGRVERLALEKKVKWRYTPFGRAQCLRTTWMVSRWSRSAARLQSGQRLNTSIAWFFKSLAFAGYKGTFPHVFGAEWIIGWLQHQERVMSRTHDFSHFTESIWRESSSDIVLTLSCAAWSLKYHWWWKIKKQTKHISS